MSGIDIAEFRAEMEGEREWRDREIRLLRNQIASMGTEAEQMLARKALVVMLYAHFEGVTKALCSLYVGRLNALSLRLGDVKPALGAASMAGVFRALRDPSTKCKEFARELPDDTALHRFARDREFVEVAWAIADGTVKIDCDAVVDTESNLKPVVLRKILYRLGFDPRVAEPWEGTMHRLLRRRNDIAHGSAKDGISEVEYVELEKAVGGVVDAVARLIGDAVSQCDYLAAA